MERIILEVFLPFIGSHGFNVYSVLCSGTYEAEVKMTLREIGEKAHVGKDTVSRTLRTMSILGMIGIKKAARGKCRTPEYELYSLREAAACGADGLREKLEAAELTRTGQRNPPKKLDLVDNGSGTFVFEETDVVELVSQKDKELQHPNTHSTEVLVSQRDKDLSQPRPTCETPGALESPVVSCLKKTPFNTREEKEIKNTIPTLPVEGLAESAVAGIDEDPEGPAWVQHFPDPANGPPPLGEVLDRLGGLKPRMGDVEDLRGQIESHMTTAGFTVRRDARIANRGDGRAGTVDLWCERGCAGEDGDKRPEFVAFELDGAVPRDRSLMKLRALGSEPYRVIVLRTGARDDLRFYPGINRVLCLGWPGNGQAERLAEAKARGEAAMLRARVGASAIPWVAYGERTHPSETPSGTTVDLLLSTVRATLEMYGAEALREWDTAFAQAGYERHEAVEGAAGGLLLVLSSPDPAETLRGLSQYAARLEPAMAERFGGRVQVQVVAWDGAVSASAEEG